MLLASGSPAAASTAATIDGALWIGCYGCGTYGPAGNAASILVTGSYGGRPTTGTPAAMPLTVNSAASPTCAISSTASGTLTVDGDSRSLVWSVVGAHVVMLITKPGVAPIEGQGVFALSDPVRPCGRGVARHTILGTGVLRWSSGSPLPCGGRVVASVAAELHGATT